MIGSGDLAQHLDGSEPYYHREVYNRGVNRIE